MRKRSKKKPFVLTEKHKLAAQIFAQGDFVTMQEVADRVGVHRSTLWRWLQNPTFRRYCERVRRAAVAKVMPEYRARMKALVRPIVREMHEAERREMLEREKKIRAEFKRWTAEHSADGSPLND